MQLTVEHLGLSSKDPERLMEWYVRVLQARLARQIAQDPPAYFLELSGGLLIEIYPSEFALPDTSRNRLAGWRHLALKVDSIEKAKAELQERGVEFSESAKPAGGGGQVLFFKDPEGNLLHLVERPAGFSL